MIVDSPPRPVQDDGHLDQALGGQGIGHRHQYLVVSRLHRLGRSFDRFTYRPAQLVDD